MELASTFSDRYLEYIFNNYPDLDASILSSVETIGSVSNLLESE